MPGRDWNLGSGTNRRSSLPSCPWEQALRCASVVRAGVPPLVGNPIAERPSELSEPHWQAGANKGGTTSAPRPLVDEAFPFKGRRREL